MSTKANQVTTQRLQSIEQRLEEMVERKWTPLREENDSEPMEVWIDGEYVRVGHVNKLWSQILTSDVIRTFDSGHYHIVGGTKVSVRPVSASEFYEVPDGMDVRRAAVVRALDETGIHVPKVIKLSGTAWLKYFETEDEAERAAAALEGPIEAAYEEMWDSGVEELEVREFEEPREWLAPDSWYAVLVRYE